jgi:Tol biopolymer transport system component/imidazolonepropionase-like amidohydrolase
MKRIILLSLGALLAPLLLLAQKSEKKWEVATPHGPHRTTTFTVSEGTWMNLDVSPDGKEIAFDLLGDIYLMPISGGKAKRIAEGLPYEIQPRFSPDGKHILFTSDRGGGDNAWIMKRDGSDARQITHEKFRLVNNAVFTPDGQYLIARKHFTSTRSLGAGELWMYHLSGTDGIQLTERRTDQKDAANDISISPDGRYVYFSEDMSSGRIFEYNKDPNGQIYMIRRYDRETGKTSSVTGGAGGACRPQVSPDGKLLAFVKRVRYQSVLYLHDLATGEEWPVYDKLSRDQQETWAIHGVYPGFSWTPDGKQLVFWAEGKIHKLDWRSLESEVIPFEAEVKQTIVDAVNFKQEVAPETFRARMIRHATTSPDGRWLAFNAAGHLYVRRLPKGKPQRLTADEHFEYEPAFSPNGESLVYTTWDDEKLGHVYIASLEELPNEVTRIRRITPQPGFYHHPQFSPDGSKVVYRKGSGNIVLGQTHSKQTGLYLCDLSEGTTELIHDVGEAPFFSADGKKVYFLLRMGGLKKFFKEIDLKTREVQSLFTSKYANQFVPSPDGKWLAFTELFQAYIIPFPQTGQELQLSAQTKAVPIQKVSKDAGTSLHWSGDSKQLHWVLGEEYFSRKISESFDFVPGATEEPAPIDSVGLKIGLEMKTDIPEGKVLIENARIISMKGDEVIEKGYLLIEKNKISAMGSGDAPEAADAYRIDGRGKTVIPGLIDVHAHLGASWNGISPQQQWSYFANLAYGVTTTHDPSISTEMVFSQSEMVEAGVMTGPRIFSTGTILYGAEGDFKAVINSIEDARSHLRRLKAVGAFSVKSYNQPRREQRQQVIQAARELEMMVVPEGGSTFLHNMTMVLDGHTGVEHSIPVNPFYKDVKELWNSSNTAYTPTLIVGYGGIWGENYWYDKTKVWEKERLLTFTPRAVVDARSRRRTKAPDEEYGHFLNAEGCKKLYDGGTKVQLGAHGQLQGLGAHWELWMLGQGGMSPLEALRCGTQYGADYIGMGHALGSLEVGKLADLVILDANPSGRLAKHRAGISGDQEWAGL